MNLVDASASNAIIECIVRNTPLLINRLPAVVEYLGNGYPLYYDDMYQAATLAMDRNRINDAYLYLTRMDKTRFSSASFINQLQTSRIYRSLTVLSGRGHILN
jgi:hypothetical protein